MKWRDEAWRDVCIHNSSTSFLCAAADCCCEPSSPHCLRSSAGGPWCKQLSEGEPSPLSFSTRPPPFFFSLSFRQASLSVVTFSTHTYTNTPRLKTVADRECVPDSVFGDEGVGGGGRRGWWLGCQWGKEDPAGWSASLTPTVTMAPSPRPLISLPSWEE